MKVYDDMLACAWRKELQARGYAYLACCARVYVEISVVAGLGLPEQLAVYACSAPPARERAVGRVQVKTFRCCMQACLDRQTGYSPCHLHASWSIVCTALGRTLVPLPCGAAPTLQCS